MDFGETDKVKRAGERQDGINQEGGSGGSFAGFF
jgi:hypothetical protein